MERSVPERSPRISVCVPTYNRAQLLSQFLPTILNQHFEDIEVLVSDNCSTDKTADVVRSCSDPRVSYHCNTQNLGPFPNMNVLLDLARGEYIAIVHDDDVYDPSFLGLESAILDGNPQVGMVHCAVFEVDEGGRRRRLVRAFSETTVCSGRDTFIRYLEGHDVCCSTVMVRRELYRRVGHFDSRYLCADFLMWMKLALQADVAYIAEPLVQMRVHEIRVTNQLDPEQWHREFVAILEEGFALGIETYPDLVGRRDELFRRAAGAQGHRFLVAALAAVARGHYRLAGDYAATLRRFEALGLPRWYSWIADSAANPLGRVALSVAAAVRRASARRHALQASMPDSE